MKQLLITKYYAYGWVYRSTAPPTKLLGTNITKNRK